MELSKPTEAMPGTSAKIELMRARAEAGLPIHIDGDNRRAVWQSRGSMWNYEFTEVIQAAIEARDAKLAKIRADRTSNA